MSKTRNDWLKWVAVACALAATASAEYSLALEAHWSHAVAWALPGSLDAYVLRAIQRHREVFTAVFAMVVVNAVSHLAAGDLIPMRWYVVTAVAAVPPLVLWRVHALRTPSEARLDVLHGVDAETGNQIRARAVPGMESTTLPADPAPSTVTCDWCEWTECPAGGLEGHKRDACVKRWEHKGHAQPVTFDTHVTSVPGLIVPPEWSTDPDACTCLFNDVLQTECDGCEHMGHREGRCLSRLPVVTPSTDPSPFTFAQWEAPSVPDKPVPATVTPLRARRSTDTVHGPMAAGVLDDRDRDALRALRDHMKEHGLNRVPAMRDVKTICKVGTDRARRVHAAAVAEHSSTDGGE